ncbi:DNA binding protein [Trifolium pratense]|uniref:DNA binding protein n=1 Tax=Trifolium pratense TaxID=57577 RepID=A0A2K3MXH6_TRIPR|nr:DNA binding protein [Trifolium pratense]
MERKHSSNNNTFKKTLQITQEGKNQNKNKSSFTEQDSLVLLQKYDASTLLKLLQEVASHDRWKINWNEMVKKTSTGISSAKEYQMLWRHLAYGHSLIDADFEDDDLPLDDDSDLECEKETLPSIPKQTALQAAACVQVMISSVPMSECNPTSATIEAPLTINVPTPSSHASCSTSSQPFNNLIQKPNIVFPVIVERQTRKRKGWTKEEDMQLQAAVEKWGEGNWADIAGRDDFTIDKTAAQLSKVTFLLY